MTGLDDVRAVADAVLYEGYLLYPYRSTSAKNQARWQFGVLGPPGAAAAGLGEEADLSVQCLADFPSEGAAEVTVHLRFLHLQRRAVEQATGPGAADGFRPVDQLSAGGQVWLSWDEAVEREIDLGPFPLSAGARAARPVEVPGGEDVELLRGPDERLIGRVVRRRRAMSALLSLSTDAVADGGGLLRLTVGVENVSAGPPADRGAATATSFLGTHLILVARGASFVSVIDPPPAAVTAAAGCAQRRCWPVLAGPEPPAGEPARAEAVLASPIILYDHPQVAEQSSGALFDSTEIDEILTLRVMTLTDEEKAAARATDPKAAAIIDRCDRLTPEELQGLHGVLRDPHALDPVAGATPFGATPCDPGFPTWTTPPDSSVPVSDSGVPWWDPAADASVEPGTDAVVVAGVEVRRGSLVRLRPSRRADAQDLFFAGQPARVTAVLSDVDGDTHVAVVLVDDPAADLHEWYGRYLYFAPDELEPLGSHERAPAETKESRS